MSPIGRAGGRALVLVAAAVASGCVLAAAGAGAGTGIYLTSRGVESVIPESLDAVAAATERAFGALEIERSGVEIDDAAQRRVYRGEPNGGPDVAVTLRVEDSGSTKVEVTARASAVTWDKDYARTVLERILTEAESAGLALGRSDGRSDGS